MQCESHMKSLINEYKRILKRHLPRNRSQERIEQLKIRRKDLRNASHAELYEKSKIVLNDIEEFIEARNIHASNFCGLRSFANHLKEILERHVLNEHEKIVNAPRKAAKAVVDTIQLIKTPPIDSKLQKIQDNIQIAVKYGSRDQKKLLIKALSASCEKIQMLRPLVQQLAS